MKVPRAHGGMLPEGTEVKLGVFHLNSKTRRAKLTADNAMLAGLGLEWAAA
ncbi:helicase [Streptomyces longwoodensis]|uniref:helicase n=1 Tax=Streptomyces longwoodensis TaxID=68231 RepID=UPI0033CA8B3E